MKAARIRTASAVIATVLGALPGLANAQGWVTLSDKDFAAQYADMAFSEDIEDRSRVAWMLFARVNRQVEWEGRTISTWETWPSDPQTFDQGTVFDFAETPRDEPEFGPGAGKLANPVDTDLPPNAEEVTRNALSYGYIAGNGLTTQAGVEQHLLAGKDVAFPVGSVEVQGMWQALSARTRGAYEFPFNQGRYALTGMHIMAKMRPTPADPFTSENPSWFMTAFEFNANPGLANARRLVTYRDALSSQQAAELMKQAGLGHTPFMNYSSNGTQIRFSDAAHADIILGESTMEAVLGLPTHAPASHWTAWSSSCHTCHATAAYNLSKGAFFEMDKWIGTGALPPDAMDGYSTLDFIWAIPMNAKPKGE